MSALPQKADIAERNRNVRFVPKADSFIAAKRCPYSMTSSAAASSARRHRKAKRFGGLQINDQLKFGRLLNWQVAGLLALEDAVDVGTRASIKVKIIDAV